MQCHALSCTIMHCPALPHLMPKKSRMGNCKGANIIPQGISWSIHSVRAWKAAAHAVSRRKASHAVSWRTASQSEPGKQPLM
eukprot:239915-Pelagomonas_calceolata.AAC.1